MARTQNTLFPGNTILSYSLKHQGRNSAGALRDFLTMDANGNWKIGETALGTGSAPVITRGGFGMPISTQSGNYNATNDDFGIYLDTTGGNRTVTLPTADATNQGQIFHVKKTVAANQLTVQAAGGGVIDGQASLIFAQQYDDIFVQSKGGGEYGIVSMGGVPINILTTTPTWIKVGVGISHTAFQTAATSNNILLYTLPAAGFVHGVKLKQSTQFAGTGITNYQLSVGWVGDLEALLPLYSVNVAVAATTFAIAQNFDSRDNGSTTAIQIQAVSTGANLSASTAGVVDVWALLSKAN